MAETTTTTSLWINRGVFALIAFVIVVLQLVPLDARPPIWAPPDILLAMTLVWVARRPDYLPVFLVALIFLFTDLLFHRPPGLWAALVVLLTEFVRSRARDFRGLPLILEWGTVAVGIVAITLANRLVLAIVATPQAPLALTLIEMFQTILIYPLAVFVAHALFGVSKGPGHAASKGARI